MKTSEAICLAILAALGGWYAKGEWDKKNKVEPPICPRCEKINGLDNGFVKRRL